MLISIPPSGGLMPGAPTQVFCPWPFYIGLPATPGACDQCTPVLPSVEECSHSSSAGLSWGLPGLTQGGFSACGGVFRNRREGKFWEPG